MKNMMDEIVIVNAKGKVKDLKVAEKVTKRVARLHHHTEEVWLQPPHNAMLSSEKDVGIVTAPG